MTRSIGVLGAEGRTECVDRARRCSSKLTLKLSAYCQRGLLAKEIIIVDNLSIGILLEVIEVLGGYLEHITCSLAVASCDERCVEVKESVLMEICVNGHGHVMTYTHHCTECIGAKTHMRMLAHILKGLTLLLHGIVITACAQDLYLRCLNLHGLT